MENVIKHKDYIGSVSYNAEDEVFHGKIIGINDLVTFEAQDAKKLKKAFIEAVEDYIKTCKDLNKEPEKIYKGSFNVRVQPELHRDAAMVATEQSVTLNKFVESAICYAVQNPAVVKHASFVEQNIKNDPSHNVRTRIRLK